MSMVSLLKFGWSKMGIAKKGFLLLGHPFPGHFAEGSRLFLEFLLLSPFLLAVLSWNLP